MSPATRLDRLLVALIDLILFNTIPAIPVMIYAAAAEDLDDPPLIVLLGVLNLFFLVFLLISLPELLLGRSIGMWIVGLAVGNKSGSFEAIHDKLIGRWLIKYSAPATCIGTVVSAYLGLIFHLKLPPPMVKGLIILAFLIGTVSILATVIDVVVFFTRAGNHSVHDAICGTAVWNIRRTKRLATPCDGSEADGMLNTLDYETAGLKGQ